MFSKSHISILANLLRRDVLQMTTQAGSGHPTSCMSAAEIVATLFFSEMRWNPRDSSADNDEFVLSKGHAAPLLYAALIRAGSIDADPLTLRKLNSPLEGHPNPRSLAKIKVATGSLGQGLSVGVGMALARRLQQRSSRVFVLLGDGEMAEGSIYEAMQLAQENKLQNLIAIVDVNRLGQSGETMVGHQLRKYKKRASAFGWNTTTINGHHPGQIKRALKKKGPLMIFAKTYKGKGVTFLENKDGWHGKSLSSEELVLALEQIPKEEQPPIILNEPPKKKEMTKALPLTLKASYKKEESIATRQAYGDALKQIAKKNKQVVVLDGEVRESTHAADFLSIAPKRFFDAYIAEQNMVGMALGLAVEGHSVFASTFAAFFTRAHDQLRMAQLSQTNTIYVGSHAGISIGQDGVSQMGLEDIALFRTLPHSTIIYPCDAVSTLKLTGSLLGNKEGSYLRLTRAKTPIIYKNTESFPVGKFKIVLNQKGATHVLVGAGITLHECLKAAKESKKKCIVVDAYSIKPFDAPRFKTLTKGKKVIVVEDHYPQGGLGEVIKDALIGTKTPITHLCIKEIPHCGKPEELLAKYAIDAQAILKEMK